MEEGLARKVRTSGSYLVSVRTLVLVPLGKTSEKQERFVRSLQFMKNISMSKLAANRIYTHLKTLTKSGKLESN